MKPQKPLARSCEAPRRDPHAFLPGDLVTTTEPVTTWLWELKADGLFGRSLGQVKNGTLALVAATSTSHVSGELLACVLSHETLGWCLETFIKQVC